MSAEINDSGPAFPIAGAAKGMSLRDWLAGQERIDPSEEIGWNLCEALAGPRPSGSYSTNPLEWFNWDNKWKAAIRYARADAMLDARKGGAK